jgi:hypothetical protein
LCCTDLLGIVNHMSNKIDIEKYAERKDKSCDCKASNGKTYHLSIVRHCYRVAWTCQITGEGSGMCHHPDPHWSAAGCKKNAIQYLEAALKERGALNA